MTSSIAEQQKQPELFSTDLHLSVVVPAQFSVCNERAKRSFECAVFAMKILNVNFIFSLRHKMLAVLLVSGNEYLTGLSYHWNHRIYPHDLSSIDDKYSLANKKIGFIFVSGASCCSAWASEHACRQFVHVGAYNKNKFIFKACWPVAPVECAVGC